jgi:hypothetical protein
MGQKVYASGKSSKKSKERGAKNQKKEGQKNSAGQDVFEKHSDRT